MGDLNNDGALELFVGGHVWPSRYPKSCSAYILRFENDRWVPDKNHEILKNIGMVRSAIFADFNQDGWVDLLISIHGGAIKLLLNQNGNLRDATTQFGLSPFVGLWTGLVAADFDGDGQLDFAAGNWGLNQARNPSAGSPLTAYYGDFNNDGTFELLETYVDPEIKTEVPTRGLAALSKGLPHLKERYKTLAEFGKASASDILGNALPTTGIMRLSHLQSTIFLNAGNTFKAHPLPSEAQFAPAFGISAADFDGDGYQDLFIAQNFTAVPPEIPRWDAGAGLLLLGDGLGKFKAVSPKASGISILGEQRGTAVSDWNSDGRMDLLVGVNGGPTRLFSNLSGRPGIRVRLRGKSPNREGIGSIIKSKGGAQTLTKGTGWLSSDSTVKIIAEQTTPISILWPGGRVQHVNITPGQKEIVVEEE
jgi:hypothetical protein